MIVRILVFAIAPIKGVTCAKSWVTATLLSITSPPSTSLLRISNFLQIPWLKSRPPLHSYTYQSARDRPAARYSETHACTLSRRALAAISLVAISRARLRRSNSNSDWKLPLTQRSEPANSANLENSTTADRWFVNWPQAASAYFSASTISETWTLSSKAQFFFFWISFYRGFRDLKKLQSRNPRYQKFESVKNFLPFFTIRGGWK